MCVCAVLRQYYAHRVSPGVLVQEIKVRNPTDRSQMLELSQRGVAQWQGAAVKHDRWVEGRLSPHCSCDGFDMMPLSSVT